MGLPVATGGLMARGSTFGHVALHGGLYRNYFSAPCRIVFVLVAATEEISH